MSVGFSILISVFLVVMFGISVIPSLTHDPNMVQSTKTNTNWFLDAFDWIRGKFSKGV